MIEIVPYTPEHFRRIDLQAGQLHWVSHLTSGYVDSLQWVGPSFTALDGERVLGSAGIVEQGMGTGILWAMACKDARPHFVALIRAVQRLISVTPLRRLEATCERAFLPGCRALELLGFTCEGLMKKYGPDGQDHFRYAKV